MNSLKSITLNEYNNTFMQNVDLLENKENMIHVNFMILVRNEEYIEN